MGMAHENDQVGFGSELDPKRLIYPGLFRRWLGLGRKRHGKHTQAKAAQESAPVDGWEVGTAHLRGS